ncbi:MAG: TrkA C-terminal domain-containing protein, partial [Myxococcales bacterium]|nr:TrkA C-terminal domain-containing protein [Myxococcales bacterium]
FSLVPLGEFSFVIAQMGVKSGRMSDTFFPACVAAVLITTLFAPVVTRLGMKLGPRLEKHTPSLLLSWQNFLGRIGSSFTQREGKERLRSKGLFGKCIQLLVEVAIVLSALAFAGPISRGVSRLLNAFAEPAEGWLAKTFELNIPGETLFEVLFWIVFCLVLLIPCVAIWNSLGAIGRILGQGLTPPPATSASSDALSDALSDAPPGGDAKTPHWFLQQAIEKTVQLGGLVLFALLCGLVMPERLSASGKSLLFLGVVAMVALLLRSPLLRWNKQVRQDLKAQVEEDGASDESEKSPGSAELAKAGAALTSVEWSLHVRELRLNGLSQAVGMSISETELRPKFGCSIVAIERQGVAIPSPTADTRLFPDDQLLLVGTVEQLDQAEAWLNEAGSSAKHGDIAFSELTTESVTAPLDFCQAGKTLSELEIASRFRVMVLGIEHEGVLVQNPAGDHPICPGDCLLVLGFPKANRAFHAWMASETAVKMASPPSNGDGEA